jgi:predicted ATPase
MAARVLPEFPDGVYFVPLAPLRNPQLVPSTIAQTIGLKERDGTTPLLDMLKAHLKSKRMLLLLDNFEQVVDAAPVVSQLLEAAGQLKVIVTSRAVLRLSAEHEFPVPPLELPDPRRLPRLEVLAKYGTRR